MRELERENGNGNRGELPALALIGAGRVGSALARAATEAGIVARLAGRADAREACEGAAAALLCVPDVAIAEACERIAGVESLRFVGHTSGAVGAEPLAAAAGAGRATFSLHPLQTIPDGDADLRGAACAVSGSTPPALNLATELAERLGMHPFEVPEDSRAAYHAAAAIASNFLVALQESAAGLLDSAGIENGRELLAPLVLRSAANWAERGGDALTGPIARGDLETVERHLAAIEEHSPELAELYRVLAERTRALADPPAKVRR
jgi:predicted short-subunit dehydrogenase-like oxidoreductase (DUF2520 family)